MAYLEALYPPIRQPVLFRVVPGITSPTTTLVIYLHYYFLTPWFARFGPLTHPLLRTLRPAAGTNVPRPVFFQSELPHV